MNIPICLLLLSPDGAPAVQDCKALPHLLNWSFEWDIILLGVPLKSAKCTK